MLKNEIRRKLGLTLLELLIVLAILAVLFALGAMLFTRQNRTVTLESAASEMSQTLLRARSLSLQSGDSHRVRIVDGSNYALESFDGTSWRTARTVELPKGVAVVAPGAGSSVTFDTRGFADFNPPDPVFTMSNGSRQQSIVPAMTGTTRFQ